MSQAEVTPEKNRSETDEGPLDFQRGISDGFQGTGDVVESKKKLYCFSCHRMEYHYNALKGTAYHHLLVGFTFGLALIFGPYRCRCCGYRRLCRFDFLNPKFHYHRWKYSGKSGSGSSPTIRPRKKVKPKSTKEISRKPDPESEPNQNLDSNPASKRSKRRPKKLKSVPIVDSIRKEREERKKAENLETYSSGQSLDYSIDGLMGSFETEESRRERLADIERIRAEKDPFVGKKAKPRKKYKGKPKRRNVKKVRMTGPNLYCFSCKQDLEHYHVLNGNPSYFFFFGITFGLISLLGPFRCSVCSKRRFMAANWLHPLHS